MPELYKYRSFDERSEGLMSSSELWFSSAAGLNDPFECRPWLEFTHTDDQLLEGMTRQLRRMKPHLTHNHAVAEAVGILLQGRHRRPQMWDSIRADLTTHFTQTVGILCMSATPVSPLMWSHYSNQHTGYCIGFEWSEYTPFFGAAQQVYYRDRLPHVEVYNDDLEQQVNNLFLTKFTHWAYEQEWRLIDHRAGPGARIYPRELMTTVIFGCRTSADNKARMRAWLSRRGHTVKVLRCILSDHDYLIELVPDDGFQEGMHAIQDARGFYLTPNIAL